MTLSFSPLLLINLSMFSFLYCSFGWSLEEYLFKYPAKLSFGSMFYLRICRSSSYILDMSFLLVIYVTNIFSHSVVCLFILLIMSYVEEKYNLMQPNILMFSLWFLLGSVYELFHCPKFMKIFCYVFFQKKFTKCIVLPFT